MSLSVSDLRAFTLVVRERSVSGAAAQLGVSQQSVSERIRRVESRLGVDLFTRLSHGMEPTSAGYRLLPYAQRTVALVDEALEVVAGDDRARIWLHLPTASSAVTFLTEALHDLPFEVVEEPDAERLLAAVAGGLADVGIGSFSEGSLPSRRDELDLDSGLEGMPTLSLESLFADPVVCVAPPGHPLAQQTNTLGEVLAAGVSFDLSVPSGPQADAGAVRMCARSTVAGELGRGELVELVIADPPGWAVPITMAFRASDLDRPLVKALRAARGQSGTVAPPAGAPAFGLPSHVRRSAVAGGGVPSISRDVA